jgi:hypothetical protein
MMLEAPLMDRLQAAIRDAVMALEEVEMTAKEVTDPAELATLLAELRNVKGAAAVTYQWVENLLLDAAGNARRLEVAGVGTVEIRKATKYLQWQHGELWKRVVALALDERVLDVDTGEYEREADAVARVLLECATPAWKLTGLRARGIQVDEFCQVEPDGFTVKLPTRKV